MLNIAVLVSGGGTNLQALLDSEARGENPNGKITLVVASKPGVFALERAAKAGVEGCVVRRKDYATSEEFDAALLETLRAHKIDLVVLAGFLSVLGPSVIAAYPRRILNVHPALIPSFCGPGMYGLRPHEAALARGCKVTGATVHFVNDERVARAIYASDIPVISAVGHEPDVTIADFVADARASTPSNAAEIAVPDQREIYRRLDALQTRMVQSEQKRVKALREQFEKTSRSRALQDPMAFIDDKRMLLDYTQKNLAALAQHQMAQRTQQFTALAAKLDALSPLKVLGRGYAVARNEQGQILRAAQEAAADEKIEVLLGQGSLNCTVNACNMGGNDDGKNV